MMFDVFLCHNSKDKPAVRALGERLRDAGFRPWLDEGELEAGGVLVGRDGMGPGLLAAVTAAEGRQQEER